MGPDASKGGGLWLATREAWSIFAMFVIVMLLLIAVGWVWRNASPVIRNEYSSAQNVNPDQIDHTIWNGDARASQPSYRPAPPTMETGFGTETVPYGRPHRRHPFGFGSAPHWGGGRPERGMSCPNQLRFNPSTGYCETTFTMPSPRPQGPGWRRSVSDHGWFRVTCIANCPR